MKDEYDFSKAERGRFHRPPVTLVPPVHLDADVHAFLSAHAEAMRVPLNDLLNDLLRKHIATMQAFE